MAIEERKTKIQGTAQKTFSIKDCFSKCDRIRSTSFFVQSRLKISPLPKEVSIITIAAIICRSSRPRVFRKKGVFEHCAKCTVNYMCQGLFFNKVAIPRHAYFIEHLR